MWPFKKHECSTCDRRHDLTPAPEPLAWFEGTNLVVSDSLVRELGITLPNTIPGYVTNRDPSIRSMRYVPTSEDEARAFLLAGQFFTKEAEAHLG